MRPNKNLLEWKLYTWLFKTSVENSYVNQNKYQIFLSALFLERINIGVYNVETYCSRVNHLYKILSYWRHFQLISIIINNIKYWKRKKPVWVGSQVGDL